MATVDQSRSEVMDIMAFKEVLDMYKSESGQLLKLYNDVMACEEDTNGKLSSPLLKNALKRGNTLLTRGLPHEMGRLKLKPTLVVTGPPNAGKSSLINELLGGTVLTASQIRCDTRLVRLVYGEKNRVILTSYTGEVLREEQITKRAIPRDFLEIGGDDETDLHNRSHVVTVELQNELLSTGIGIVDFPSLIAHREPLDEILARRLQDVEPIILYVIDGNDHLNHQVRDDITQLRRKQWEIIFVVTKMESKDDAADEISALQNKKESAYGSLIQNGFLPPDVKMNECSHFHGISNWKVKEFRRQKLTGDNPFINDFVNFQRAIYQITASLTRSIFFRAGQALKLALSNDTEFVKNQVSDSSDVQLRLKSAFGESTRLENQVFQSAMTRVKENKVKVRANVEKIVRDLSDNIEHVYGEEVRVGLLSARNSSVENGRQEQNIEDHVKATVNDKIDNELSQLIAALMKNEDDILCKFAESMTKLQMDCSWQSVERLNYFIIRNYKPPMVRFKPLSWIANFQSWMHEWCMWLFSFVNNDAGERRRYNAKAKQLLASIDTDSLSEDTYTGILSHIRQCKEQYKAWQSRLESSIDSGQVAISMDVKVLGEWETEMANLMTQVESVIQKEK
ncbi:uncharacterized protein [Ptychodera flava]|uniref:uncharacterized protein n=1 Tax=Ptychodera flava TaxID=63121 RepID=UPI003969F2D5